MRWESSVSTACSTRSCLRLSVKQAATCRDRPRTRSASRNNNAPAFEVMAPPSKAAVTFRLPKLAKSRESWLHSVCIGDVLWLGLKSASVDEKSFEFGIESPCDGNKSQKKRQNRQSQDPCTYRSRAAFSAQRSWQRQPGRGGS